MIVGKYSGKLHGTFKDKSVKNANNPEHILEHSGEIPEQILDKSWNILEKYRRNSGKNPEQILEKSGNIPELIGKHPGEIREKSRNISGYVQEISDPDIRVSSLVEFQRKKQE